MKTSIYLGFLAAVILSQSLSADEIWNSTYGKVVYETEIDKTAVWRYSREGDDGLIFINNLAGVYEGRGSYQGYWVQATSAVKCKTQRGMKKNLSSYWGRFEIEFLDPDFPSRWQAKWSYCDNKPTTESWLGTPITN